MDDALCLHVVAGEVVTGAQTAPLRLALRTPQRCEGSLLTWRRSTALSSPSSAATTAALPATHPLRRHEAPGPTGPAERSQSVWPRSSRRSWRRRWSCKRCSGPGGDTAYTRKLRVALHRALCCGRWYCHVSSHCAIRLPLAGKHPKQHDVRSDGGFPEAAGCGGGVAGATNPRRSPCWRVIGGAGNYTMPKPDPVVLDCLELAGLRVPAVLANTRPSAK